MKEEKKRKGKEKVKEEEGDEGGDAYGKILYVVKTEGGKMLQESRGGGGKKSIVGEKKRIRGKESDSS